MMIMIWTALSLLPGAQPETIAVHQYGVGVLGNCCTHGAGACAAIEAHPRFHVIAAYEEEPRRAEELRQVLGAPLAGSYDEVIANTEVEVVAITSDPCEKADLVEKAAAAGKHIFLNKPACGSLDDARRIVEAVRLHGVRLVYDIPMVRDVPVFARLLTEVKAGRHGKAMGYHHLFGMNFAPDFDLKGLWPERLDPAGRSGGGELTNMGCYAIDFAVALFGAPKAVSAKWRKEWDVYKQADVEHFGQIILDYGEFYAFLEAGKQQLTGDRRNSNRMTINFEHTTLAIDASAGQAAINHVPVDYAAFEAGAKAVGSLDQLVMAIENQTPPSSGAECIIPATEALMAAYQSIIQGGGFVNTPLASGANPLTAQTAGE